MVCCRKAGGAAHVGPAGVLAVIPGTTSKQLKAIVAAARAFAAEWIELRSIFQSKLFGHVLRPPLQVCPHLLTVSLCLSARKVQECVLSLVM